MTEVNYAKAFVVRTCMTCGETFDLDPALHKRRTCFACSPAGPPRPPLPPPAAELRVPWTAEREARGAAPDRGPRCLSPGCPIRYASGPSRPCPDHRDEAEDEPVRGAPDPRLAALPDAPVLTPAERAARRARLVTANEQLMRGRGAGWVSPASERQRTRERDRRRLPPRLTALPATATAAAFPPRCTVAVSVTARPAAATASAAAAGARCTVTLPGGSAVVIAALPWSAAAGATAGLAAASAAGAGAAVRTRGSPAQALLADCHRSNRAIAAEIGVNRNAVAAARLALEAAGMIPFFRAAGNTHSHPPREPRLRAEAGRLLCSAGGEISNTALARLAGCGKDLVSTVRKELEAEGLIPVWLAPRSTRNAWARPGTVRR